MPRRLFVLFAFVALFFVAAACGDGDGEGATSYPPAGPETEGGCEHGVGQSVLFIAFTGLEPGQTLTGTVQGVGEAAGGVLGDGTFTVMADANGNGTAEVNINQFGLYEWSADGIDGSFEVTQTCPGPPGSGGATG